MISELLHQYSANILRSIAIRDTDGVDTTLREGINANRRFRIIAFFLNQTAYDVVNLDMYRSVEVTLCGYTLASTDHIRLENHVVLTDITDAVLLILDGEVENHNSCTMFAFYEYGIGVCA